MWSLWPLSSGIFPVFVFLHLSMFLFGHIFHNMDIPPSSSSLSLIVICFHYLATINNVAIDIPAQTFR